MLFPRIIFNRIDPYRIVMEPEKDKNTRHVSKKLLTKFRREIFCRFGEHWKLRKPAESRDRRETHNSRLLPFGQSGVEYKYMEKKKKMKIPKRLPLSLSSVELRRSERPVDLLGASKRARRGRSGRRDANSDSARSRRERHNLKRFEELRRACEPRV